MCLGFRPFAVLIFALISLGCSNPNYSGGSNSGQLPDYSSQLQATATLEASPMDTNDVSYIIALGNLNPPDHTFPSDHMYFVYVDRNRTSPVYAPGTGYIQHILQPGGTDYKMIVQFAKKWSYYVDHVNLNSGFKVGDSLTAGQKIGTASQLAAAMDLGIINQDLTLTGFMTPARYYSDNLHADSPLKYYQEPLRTTLYAKVDRAGSDKDGKIDYDVAGRLVGNWFLESLSVGESSSQAAWSKSIAFVYDVRDPSAIRVSIGGILSVGAGAYSVQQGAIDPKDVSTDTGKVSYKLSKGPQSSGLLIAQMLSANRVKVETFATSTAATADFTSAAQVYTR